MHPGLWRDSPQELPWPRRGGVTKQISKFFDNEKIGQSNSNFEGRWRYTSDLNLLFKDADAIIILTEWEEYLHIKWKIMSKLMRKPSWLFDTRGIVEEEKLNGSNINI